MQFSTDKLDELKRETKADVDLEALRAIIAHGWPDKQRLLQPALRPYWAYRDELSLEDGLILKGPRIVIPARLQRDYAVKIHSGHQGSEKCKLRAKSCIFWNNINSDIDKITSSCDVCQQYQRSQAHETLMQHELPTRPWQVLGTDLFYFDNGTFLIIADYYSKFQFVRKLSGQCTSQQVITLTKQIFSEHGVPEKVISDNGPHFDSQAYRNFAESWGFDHVTSSPYYPRSNGFIERCVQTTKNTLKKAKADNADPYMALLCLRTTPLDHQVPSPAELLYTRKIQGNLPVRIPNQLANKDNIYERLLARQATQKAYHDRTAHDLTPLLAGQPVSIQNTITGQWQPGVVRTVCDEPRSYIVSTTAGRDLRRNRQQIRHAPTMIHIHDDDTPSQQTTDEGEDTLPNTNNNQQPDRSLAYTTRSGRRVHKPSRWQEG